QQEKLLRENVQIMVGTPGRVLDLNKSGRMNLMNIAFLVLDEADRMFDMGFYPDLRKLIKVVPPANRRQTMLFSATLNSWVKNLAWEYTHSPCEIEIKPEIITVEEVDQILYHVPSADKMKLLIGILDREKPESAIIFCNTKKYTEIAAKRLRLNGYACEFIMGDLPQVKRLKVINDLKAGKTNILVATDVAARGLDIEALAMVVNYDLPVEAENYVHRIGRTARAGKTGRAITLASEQDVYELPAIERYIGKKIPSEIAAPDLYAEDKSTGHHVRTEADEYPREERRNVRRPHGSAKAGDGRGGRSHERTRGHAGKRLEGTLKSGTSGSGASRSSASRNGASGNSVSRSGASRNSVSRNGALQSDKKNERNKQQEVSFHETQDLSQLSFDERMVLYKQKYSSVKQPQKQTTDIQPEQTKPEKKGIFSGLLAFFKKRQSKKRSTSEN
ncbi:MAG: DEAD/DEAH box helicase, partial [Treponema sp.]|nr:DEAD/DEAH box helicase [Treponema sp.]